MEKFNQQIVWVELNVDSVKQNLERQQAIQKSKKQNWNNCKKTAMPVGTRPKMNVFCTFKIGPFVLVKKGRLLDVF